MSNSGSPRILIIGAGAVGAYIGGYFSRAGDEVVFVDMWPQNVDALRRNGLQLQGLSAEECFRVPVRALHLHEVQSLVKERPADIAIIAVKSYDTRWATALAQEYLAPEGFVLSLQNGINEPVIADIVGWSRTVGCIASKIIVELVEPALVRRSVQKGGSRHTVFRVGEIHGRTTARVEQLHSKLALIDSARISANLWGERWTKLVQNAMANAVSAATGLSNKEMTQIEQTRRLSIRVAGEAVRVGQALGYALEKVNGLDPQLWVAAAAELSDDSGQQATLAQVEETMLAAAGKMSSDARPSMGQDILKGRRTEIEYLNGLVVREAQTVAIEVPANAALVRAVQQIERGMAKAGLAQIADV